MPNTFQNIPNPSDLLSVSQGDIKGNFGYIQGALGKDHQIVFGDSDTGTSFEGRHLQVSLKNQNGSAPTITDGANSMIYSDNGNIFWTSASAAGPFQLTNLNGYLAATNGYSFLPGGILLQWGNFAIAGVTTNPTFPIAFTTVYTVVAIPSVGDRTGAVTAIIPSGFTFVMDNSGVGVIRWFAVGAK